MARVLKCAKVVSFFFNLKTNLQKGNCWDKLHHAMINCILVIRQAVKSSVKKANRPRQSVLPLGTDICSGSGEYDCISQTRRAMVVLFTVERAT
jgi:hypothetical protein